MPFEESEYMQAPNVPVHIVADPDGGLIMTWMEGDALEDRRGAMLQINVEDRDGNGSWWSILGEGVKGMHKVENEDFRPALKAISDHMEGKD